jgi:tetratricopeptide (TPR) repeat protein
MITWPGTTGGKLSAVVFLACLVAAPLQLSSQTRAKAPSPDEQLQRRYDAARTYQLAGDTERAASEYSQFLASALAGVANLRSRTGDFETAVNLFDEAVRLAPGNPELLLAYSTIRLQQGKLLEARKLAEQALESAPDDIRAKALLGRVLFDQGEYKAARQYLEAAVVAAPGFDLGYMLGVIYIRLNDLPRARMLFEEMLTGLGDTAKLHIYFGRAYREGDFEAWDYAIQEFGKAIAKDPKLPQAHYFRALAYLQRDGESGFGAAVPDLEAELRINPRDERSHYLLGYIFIKQHKDAEAEKSLRRSAELDPKNPDALVLLGTLLADAGRDKEAEPILRKAIELTTDVSRNDYQINRPHYVLARILLRTGRKEEGEKHLQISQELRNHIMHPELVKGQTLHELANISRGTEPTTELQLPMLSDAERKQAEEFVERLKPAIGDSYNNLGVILAGKKDFSSALQCFRAAAEWSPKLETLARNWGMAAFYAGQHYQAVEPLSRELERHPDDVRVRAALGLSWFAVQKFPNVLETLKPIQAEVDADPGLQYAYAVSLLKTGEYPEGVRRLRLVEKGNPNSADIHMLLGQAFAEQNEHATAVEEYRKALALDAKNPQLYFLIGLSLIQQGAPAEATENFRKALKLRPDDVPSKYHLAYSLIQMQQKDEARRLLEEVVKQDPSHANAHYELGKLQLEAGEVKAAIANFEAGVKVNPESDYLHYQLAMAYRRDSRADDAAREIKVYQTLKNRIRGRNAPQSQ